MVGDGGDGVKECPLINECKSKVTKRYFKDYCQVKIGIIINYNDCYTYSFMLKKATEERKPKDWK